jgi:hypothetical protein
MQKRQAGHRFADGRPADFLPRNVTRRCKRDAYELPIVVRFRLRRVDAGQIGLLLT